MKREKKKLEKNQGKEEDDENPGSDTNYMSADEEKDIDVEKRNKLFEFEYHIALINLIARCCGGENSATKEWLKILLQWKNVLPLLAIQISMVL